MGDGFDYFAFSDFLAPTVETDAYETIFSTRSDDNANIKSYYEATAERSISDTADSELTLVEAYSNYVDWGTSLYTQRNIGSDDITSLVRSGDTVSATAYWSNAGSYSEYLNKVEVLKTTGSSQLELMSTGLASALSGENSLVDGFDISQMMVLERTVGDDLISGISSTPSDSFSLDLDVKVLAQAGTVLSDFDFYKLDGQNGDASTSTNVSSNLVTFAGDLNYDGRVSLKDLAFLNAGVLAKAEGQEYSDVDANFDTFLDVRDLATLSDDFGKSLHDQAAALTATSFSETIDASMLTSVSGNLTNSSANSVVYENSSYDVAKEIYGLDAEGTAAMGDLDTDPQYLLMQTALDANAATFIEPA
jgi:hypothetical protein